LTYVYLSVIIIWIGKLDYITSGMFMILYIAYVIIVVVQSKQTKEASNEEEQD